MEELKSTDTSAIRAFIFDLDGTLCNTLPDLLRAMNAMLSRMGYPESANDTPELIDYLRVLRDEGFFNAEEPYVLSMEVTLRPGEDEDIVLANTKRVLNRAWAMLED